MNTLANFTAHTANTARPGTSPEPPGRHSRPGSLTDLLRRREEVARCAGALAVRLGTTVEQAEALLMGEARRRRVPVDLVARRVIRDTAAAREWTVEVCPECGDALRVAALERYGLGRELSCPTVHQSPGPDTAVTHR